MSDKTKAIIVILVGAFISGAISSVTKIGLLKIPPFSFSFVRFLISSLCLLPFLTHFKIKLDRNFLLLVIVSILPVLNIVFFVLGVRTTTASISQMLYAGTPILVGILSYFIIKQRLSLKRWLYIFLGLVGVLYVILIPLISRKSLYSGDLTGNLLITLGVIIYSFYVVYSKKFQTKYSPVVITAVFIFLSTLIFFLLSVTEINNQWWNHLSPSSVYALIYISIFGTVLSYILGQYAIKFGGPVIASLTLYLQPIFAYISAYFLLGEKLTMELAAGTVIVFISIFLLSLKK